MNEMPDEVRIVAPHGRYIARESQLQRRKHAGLSGTIQAV
jgi:hypothetical protein